MTSAANTWEGGGTAASDLGAKLDALREHLRAKRAAIEREWRAEAEALLTAPGMGRQDLRDLRMVLRWRKPGRRGLEIVADIKAKLATAAPVT